MSILGHGVSLKSSYSISVYSFFNTVLIWFCQQSGVILSDVQLLKLFRETVD